jgi:hypothetical protein
MEKKMKKTLLNEIVGFSMFGVALGIMVAAFDNKTPYPAENEPVEMSYEMFGQCEKTKVVITCDPGHNELDFDCDGISDEIDNNPTVPNPDQAVVECLTYHDCSDGFVCRRGQCEEAKIVLVCVPGHNELDFDCDGIGNDIDACPDTIGTTERHGCP